MRKICKKNVRDIALSWWGSNELARSECEWKDAKALQTGTAEANYKYRLNCDAVELINVDVQLTISVG